MKAWATSAAVAVLAWQAGVWAQNVTVVYTIDGKGDKGFNDSAAMGVAKAGKELGAKVSEVEPRSKPDAQTKMEEAAKNGADLIIGISFDLTEQIKAAAAKYPKTHFAIVDSVAEGPNVASLVFKEHEGSYLAGFAAAKASKTGKLGFVGGMEIPPIQRFLAGYQQGAKAANAKAEVLHEYIGTDNNVWNNPTQAKAIARKQYAAGADVIYAVAGGSGLGVIDAAKEVKKMAVGVDSNQNGLAPGFVVTSMLKRLDNAIVLLVKSVKDKTFKSGVQAIGVKEGGVDLAIDDNTKKILDAKILSEIEALKKKIESGQVKISDKPM